MRKNVEYERNSRPHTISDKKATKLQGDRVINSFTFSASVCILCVLSPSVARSVVIVVIWLCKLPVQISVCSRSSYLHYADILSGIDLVVHSTVHPEAAFNHRVQTEICHWTWQAGICCFGCTYRFLLLHIHALLPGLWCLLIRLRTRLSVIGDRALPVATSRLWNTLPQNVTSAPSLTVFRKRLKTHLFNRSDWPLPNLL